MSAIISAATPVAHLGAPCGLSLLTPALRWALVEAAQKSTTGGDHLREHFERITARRGRKVAKVAVARHILTLSYYGLRDGEIRCLARRSRASTSEKLAAPA